MLGTLSGDDDDDDGWASRRGGGDEGVVQSGNACCGVISRAADLAIRASEQLGATRNGVDS